LSQTVKFSSEQIKTWLETETSSILPPVQKQAQKLLNEMSQSLQSLSETSKMLLDNSAKEIEKRNMRIYNRARALNKLARLFIDRIRKVTIPEHVSYDSLNNLSQETQKVFNVIEIDIRNWFPRISPFFILDRRKFLTVYEKSKLTLSTLTDFLTKDYIKTKTLEETFHLITELQTLEGQSQDLESQKESLKKERLLLENEMAELEKKATEVKDKGTINHLRLVEAEAENLNAELKHALRHLQKPFVKMQALAIGGGGAYLTPDELKSLGGYMEKPFEAFVAEEPQYPILKEILQKLTRLMDEDKLKLKSDKAKKAEQALADILKRDSLANIQKRSIEVATRKRQISASPEMEESKRKLASLNEQLEKLSIRRAGLEANEAVKENMNSEILERIHHRKKTIETNIQEFLDKKVQIL
jgi:hypothetical protein